MCEKHDSWHEATGIWLPTRKRRGSHLLAHHELVIGGGHFKRFLHKHGIDDANRRKADDELIGNGEDAVVLLGC